MRLSAYGYQNEFLLIDASKLPAREPIQCKQHLKRVTSPRSLVNEEVVTANPAS